MKKIQLSSLVNINFLILFATISLGIYLCLVGGYGSDEDTLPMIGAFESILKGEKIMASRFTPYPVAELGIGFLSYFFGSWAANIITFIFFILSLFFFYFTFSDQTEIKKIVIFLLLCLSNPFLFFDNLEPMDYSWALLALFMGSYFLKKNLFELAIVFFGISIGTRIYFLVFVWILIYFFKNSNLTFLRRNYLFICSFFIGGLFYLPFWFENNLSLHWLYAVTPSDQGIIGLIGRFFYKTTKALNLFVLLVLIFLFFKKILIKDFYKIHLRTEYLIIIMNLIIFVLIPAEISYLQPLLVCFYFLVINFNLKIIYSIIILNFLSWVINIDYLKINYLSDDKCNNVNAISAEFKLSFKNGYFYEFINTRDKIKCWIKPGSARYNKIISGKALK